MWYSAEITHIRQVDIGRSPTLAEIDEQLSFEEAIVDLDSDISTDDSNANPDYAYDISN